VTPRERFLQRIAALGTMCGFPLDPKSGVLHLYELELAPLGYERAAKAIEEIVRTRKGTDRFPSIADIRNLIVPEPGPEVEAIEAANRIVEALSRFGGCNADVNEPRAREFVGELGWLVVQRHGGWVNLVESGIAADQIPTLKAQWRELAKALWARAKAGRIHQPPTLPRPATGQINENEPESIRGLVQCAITGTTPGGSDAAKTILPPSRSAPEERGQARHDEGTTNQRAVGEGA